MKTQHIFIVKFVWQFRMFKVFPFFQKHFKKCNIPPLASQQSVLPSGVLKNNNSGIEKEQENEVKTPGLKHFKSSAKCKPAATSTDKSTAIQNQIQGLELKRFLNEKLRFLERIVLTKTRTVRKTMGFLHDSGIVVTEFEILNDHEEKIFDIELQQGDLLEEFGIKLFDPLTDTLVCCMHLESNLEIKNLVLKIQLPNKVQVGSVCEEKGMSKTTFIRNSENQLVHQVFTHRGLSGFGWTTSAKILNPEGNQKLGDVQISKFQSPDTMSILINLPPTKENEILNKLLVLGACLILIKDY